MAAPAPPPRSWSQRLLTPSLVLLLLFSLPASPPPPPPFPIAAAGVVFCTADSALAKEEGERRGVATPKSMRKSCAEASKSLPLPLPLPPVAAPTQKFSGLMSRCAHPAAWNVRRRSTICSPRASTLFKPKRPPRVELSSAPKSGPKASMASTLCAELPAELIPPLRWRPFVEEERPEEDEAVPRVTSVPSWPSPPRALSSPLPRSRSNRAVGKPPTPGGRGGKPTVRLRDS
mmetsp:Transcript_90509/g.180651  ORF Transcript_90509/g.180651 Transcript_90509/m.180651 type:complete len:232 (-) Transcript_90509:474-1169(-)